MICVMQSHAVISQIRIVVIKHTFFRELRLIGEWRVERDDEKRTSWVHCSRKRWPKSTRGRMVSVDQRFVS